MIKKLIIILTITFSIFACQSKKGNFSVITPKNWIVKDTVDKDHERFIKMHAPINSSVPVFVENINIGIMHSTIILDYAKGVIDGIRKKAIYFEEKGSGSIKVNKYKAEWEHHIIQLDNNSDIIEQIIYFINDHGSIYQIVCSARANELQNIKKEIDTVLNSFSIL